MLLINNMYKSIQQYIRQLDTDSIEASRKQLLEPLADYLKGKYQQNESIALQFICTHNSRRSHLGQVWALAMASFYQIDDILSFSGGTQVTAVYPQILKTLQEQYFKVQIVDNSKNPLYAVLIDENNELYLFSKKYDHSSNPEESFAAIMTCSQADGDCPFIPGAERRFAITYEDPKIADGTDQESSQYLIRSIQIATEMKYVFSKIK